MANNLLMVARIYDLIIRKKNYGTSYKWNILDWNKIKYNIVLGDTLVIKTMTWILCILRVSNIYNFSKGKLKSGNNDIVYALSIF